MKKKSDKQPLRTVADYLIALEEERAGRGRIGAYKPFGVDYFQPEGPERASLPYPMRQLAAPFRRLGRKEDGLHRHNIAVVLKLLSELDTSFDPRKPLLPPPLRSHPVWKRLLDGSPSVFGVFLRYVAQSSTVGTPTRRRALVQWIDDQLSAIGTKWESVDAVKRFAASPNIVKWGSVLERTGAVAKNRNPFRLAKAYAEFREFATHEHALFPEDLKSEIARASEEIVKFLDGEYKELHGGAGELLSVRFADVKMAGKYVHMLRRDAKQRGRAKALSNAIGLQIWDELRGLDPKKDTFSDKKLHYLTYSMMHVLFPAQHKDFPNPALLTMLGDRVRRIRDRERARSPK